MNSLFEKYKKEDKIIDALLVGKNMLNKNPEDHECFTAYVNYLIDLVENKSQNIEEKRAFIGQAYATVSFYEENAKITPDVIKEIHEIRDKIGKLENEIYKEEEKRAEDGSRQIKEKNDDHIKELFRTKEKIDRAKSNEEFDNYLKDIGLIDEQIEHEYLDDKQKNQYDELNKECTEIISKKMRDLEYKSNIEYNKKAVKAYNEAFTRFKNDKSKYKSQTELFKLVSSTLFAYDDTRLFNETLIYYNHVYSYIFSDLDEDGKLAITKYSIECERKMG